MTHLQVKPGHQMAEAVAEATLSKAIQDAKAVYPQNGAIVLDLASYPGRITRAELARILGFRPDPANFEGFNL